MDGWKVTGENTKSPVFMRVCAPSNPSFCNNLITAHKSGNIPATEWFN